jgi:hypothetical protein
MSPLFLPPAAERAFRRMADDLTRVFGDRFLALLAYTTSASLAFAREMGPPDFEALGPLVEGWHREGLATPLVLTPDEFTRSLDAFPLEYQAILDRHVVIAGQSPIAGAVVNANDLRRACEVQAKAHLVHLRQGWLEAGGHADRLAALVQRSAGPFHLLLVHVARLAGAPADDLDGLVEFAERVVGMPGTLVRDVLDLEHTPDRSRAVARHIGEYAGAIDRLWYYVDSWRAR